MREMRFSLNISSKQYLDYYRGFIKQVVTTSYNGQRLQFPASALQPFVTRDGIRGNFRILYSDQNKLIRIERV